MKKIFIAILFVILLAGCGNNNKDAISIIDAGRLNEDTKRLGKKVKYLVCSKEFAENILYLGNLSIYSTENSAIQSALENEFSKKKYILPATNENNKSSEAAMVIMDHKTGYVLGTVGSLGTKNTARGFNRATQAYRQTGSASKPIAVLAPALAEGLITSSSVFEDVETTFDDNTEEGYTPTNYNSYRGNITVRQAIEIRRAPVKAGALL